MFTHRHSRGFSLIEALVAAFIFATGILGITSLQLKSLGALSNSSSINSAMLGASDLVDRMHANPNGVQDGFYDSLSGADVEAPSCSDDCSSSQLALLDVATVYQQLSNELPSATLTVSNLGNNIFTIDVTWTERVGNQSETKRHRVSFLPYKP